MNNKQPKEIKFIFHSPKNPEDLKRLQNLHNKMIIERVHKQLIENGGLLKII